jgi:hypothetical protein
VVAGQAHVHELVANGAPLEESLDSLLRVVEAQSPGMLGSILLLDADGTHVRHLARPACRSNSVARSTANRSAKAPGRAEPPCIDAKQ